VESMTRVFTNVGTRDCAFQITHKCSSLSVSPQKGLLKVGKSVHVLFSFLPTDESMLATDILFEPEFSEPVKLKMQGGGGFVKCSLSKYRRFDFGKCMIGKNTVSNIPIVNEGNAVLHIQKFDLAESTAFFKDPAWPSSR
jgi:hypothetical protein